MKPILHRLACIVIVLALCLMLLPAVHAQPLPQGEPPADPLAGSATLLSEDFESGALPANWQALGTPGWRFDNPGNRANNTGGAGKFAIADSDNAGNVAMTTEMRTPALNLSGYTVVTLNFKTYYKYYGSEIGSVDLSLDGGTTWAYSLWQKQGANFNGPVSVPLPPAAIGQTNVKLRFRYANAYNAWYWQVDEVRLEASGGAQPPAAPGPITFGAVTETSIVVNWADNSTNETGFKLERSPNGMTGWAQIATPSANAITYTDAGLTCSTIYYYRVRATNASGDSAYSASQLGATLICPSVPPTAPSELTVTSAGAAQIGMRWKDNSSDETGFKLERSPDGATGWTELGTFNANTTSGADNTITCGLTRFYRIRAANASGNSAYSNVVSSTTTACPPAVPAAPSGLTVTPSLLTWTDNSNDEVGFAIGRSLNGTDGWTRAGLAGAGVTSFAYTNPPCGTVHYYIVFGYNINGASLWSNVVQIAGPACPPPPPTAPSNLAAPNAKQAEVTLTWTDTSANETGFKIERSPDGSTGWTQMDTVGANIATYTNIGLACNTRYSYRVRAASGNGDSAYSNAADALTTACSAALTELNESFNSPSLPAGWTILPASGITAWAFNNPGNRPNDTGGSTYFAIADSDKAGRVAMDAELRTPPLNLSAHTAVKLIFKTNFRADGNSTADVDVSLDGGATWMLVKRKTGADYKGTVTLDVPQAIGQSNVMFRFHYYNANYAWYWLIDDVQVPNALVSSQPGAPGNLSAQVADTNINLSWTDNSSNETNFIVERSPDGANGWVETGQVGANVATFTLQNVTCNTTVFYRVKAINGNSPSGYSNSANITMPMCPPVSSSIIGDFDASASLPAGWTVVDKYGAQYSWKFDQPNQGGTTGNAPLAKPGTDSELRTPLLNLSLLNSVSVKFNSRLNKAYQNASNGVEVDVSKDGGATWTNVWRKSAIYNGQELVTLDVSAYAAGQAKVMVRFVSRLYAFSTDFWQIDNIEIGTWGAPSTPADLTALSTSGGREVLLVWGGDAGTKYKLERSANGGSNWMQVADLANGATTYVDKYVASTTTYQYRVSAYNAAGQSAFSAASVTVPDITVRYVDVTMSLYSGAPINNAADRARYENIFGYFADALYEASNGANRLRKITIYRDAKNWDSVHVQWTNTLCRPNATLGGYVMARGGPRVLMCDVFSSTNFLANDTGQRGAGAVLAHEFGHYFYGLKDEYKEPTSGNGYPGSPQPSDTPSNYSIMSDAWKGWNDFRWLNFSAATSDFSMKTAQGRVFGVSAWAVLARPNAADPQNDYVGTRPYWPELAAVAPAPGELPRIDLTLPGGSYKARATLQIVWEPGFTTRVSDGPNAVLAASNNVVREIVIDRSALMADSGYLDEVKAAVSTLIDQLPAGDTLGLIAFDGTVTVVQPLTDVTGQAAKDTLIAAVNSIAAGDAQAAGGVALQEALNALTAPNVPVDTTRVVYYITTGGNTTAPAPNPIIVMPGYQDAGIPLHVFGFDPLEGDETELRQLADLTEGEYSTVKNATDLQKAFGGADQDTSPTQDVILTYDESDLAAGEMIDIPVMADATLGALDFEITYFGGPFSAIVTLINPLGGSYQLDPNNDCESWGTGAEAETTCYMGYLDPAGYYPGGYWTIRIEAIDDIYVLYYVGGVAIDGQSTYNPTLAASNGDVVEYPQPIAVRASVSRDYPIGGLTATGWVYAPDGSALPVDFYDDGVAPDAIADDGYYSAYVDYTLDGEHWVTVHFDNHAGTGFYTDRGLMTTNPEPLPPIIEDFERYAEYQVTVQGWQPDDHADWPNDPDWPATPLLLDNIPVHGRIDFENDTDVFQVTVPLDYTGTLGVRINRLGLGMDPYVVVYAADYSWQFERYLEFTPTSDDMLFIPIDVAPGETFYIEVWHYDETVATGTYNISAGTDLWSDPIAKAKDIITLFLPLIMR